MMPLKYYQEARYSIARLDSSNDLEDGGCFDWYQDYSTLKQHLAPYLDLAGQRLMMKSTGTSSNQKDIEILIPGCGNSSKQLFFFSNTTPRH